VDVQQGTGELAPPARLARAVRSFLDGRADRLTDRQVLALGAVVLAGALLVGALGADTVAKRFGEAPKVVTALAGPATIDNAPGGIGTLVAVPELSFSVSLDVVGVSGPIVVERVDVIDGSNVRPGTPLLQLDPDALRRSVTAVRLALAEAENGVETVRRVLAEPSPPDAGYLAVQLSSLEGQVAIEQNLLQVALGNTSSITAPMAGTVVNVRVEPGQVIGDGDTMLEIVDTRTVQVEAGLQLADLQTVTTGETATVTPVAVPDVHLRGHVSAISPQATSGGLEGTVTVQVPNLAGHPLPIGTQVFVSISAPRRVAVAVPAVSVINIDLAPAVFVVRGGRVFLTDVTVGVSDDSEVQVLSGLRPGDRVVVSGLQTLLSGDRVRVIRG
jgi:RND family efflux transporter MFP subunit